MGHRLLSIATILLVAAPAFAGDGTYVIKRSPKVGETNKMAMKAELTVSGAPATLTTTVVEKVTKVDADGTYTTEESQIGGKVKFKDFEMDAVSTAPSVSKYKPSGEVLEYLNEQGKSDLRPANLGVFRQPDKSVKVGESWVWEGKGDTKLGVVGVRGIYTVLGEETVGKVKCLKIKTAVNETEGVEPGAIEGTLWLDLSDWRIVKQVSKWTNVPMNGGTPASGTITLSRIEG